MKIQPSSTPKSLASKTKKTKSSSNTFGTLFSSQIENEPAISAPEQHVQTNEQHQPSPSNFMQTLHELEDVILNLKSGSGENLEDHQNAQDAISKLRHALTQQDNFTHLSAHDIQEAETLLAVEAKRLENLDKYK